MSRLISISFTATDEAIYNDWVRYMRDKYPYLPDKNITAGQFIKHCISYYDANKEKKRSIQ